VTAEEAVCALEELQAVQALEDQRWQQVVAVAERLRKAVEGVEGDLRATTSAAVKELEHLASQHEAASRHDSMEVRCTRPTASNILGNAHLVASNAISHASVAAEGAAVEPEGGGSGPDKWACLETLSGHVGGVWGLAVVCPGLLTSGDDGGFLRIWDLKRKKREVACLPSGGGWLNCIKKVDDSRVASGSQDGVVRIWDVELYEKASSLSPCRSEILSITVLGPEQMAGGCTDGVVVLWDLRTGKQAALLQTKRSAVYGMVSLGDGKLAIGCADGNLRLWDTRSSQQEEPNVIPADGGPIWSLSSSGTCVYSGFQDGAIKLWDLIAEEGGGASLRKRCEIGGGGSKSLCLAPLGPNRMASGHLGDSLVRIWNPAADRCVAELKGHQGAVRALDVLPGGGLASGSQDGKVKIWEPVAVE